MAFRFSSSRSYGVHNYFDFVILILLDHYNKTLESCCQFGAGLTELRPEKQISSERKSVFVVRLCTL